MHVFFNGTERKNTLANYLHNRNNNFHLSLYLFYVGEEKKKVNLANPFKLQNNHRHQRIRRPLVLPSSPGEGRF